MVSFRSLAREGNIITCWYKPQIARIHTDYYFLARNTRNAQNTTVFIFRTKSSGSRVFSAVRAFPKRAYIPLPCGGVRGGSKKRADTMVCPYNVLMFSPLGEG